MLSFVSHYPDFVRKTALWGAVAVIGILIFTVSSVAGRYLFVSQENNLAPLPPMGWNGWNRFRCSDEVNERMIKNTAEIMVQSGMKDAGYRYVVLDDCWQVSRTG